jgi:3,4-dihydroxyphenylacetate 2,3-dioxygenase
MRYMHMDPGNHFTVVSIAAWCNWHKLEDSARFGLAVRRAIEERYDGTVAILASGSLSHRFNDNGSPEDSIHEISDEFYRQIDLRVVELWQKGDWKTFVKMLPTYNATCHGEGHMHDTAMLLGALGWDRYDRTVEVITPYFASSGTGQINAVFPVTPLSA